MSSTDTASAGAISFHEVLLRWGLKYLQAFIQNIPTRQREVLERILRCRTPVMGGSLYVCPDCGKKHYACHSCNDRHCPRCGRTDSEQWLRQRRQRLLLPVPFFLVTFTVPEGLRKWIRSHPREGYDLLFAASTGALQDLAVDRKRLNGTLGFLSVLHTWSRTLIYHPHIHCLVPGGVLSHDQLRWHRSGQKFLLPVRPLGKRFRTLFGNELKKRFPESLQKIPAKVWRQNWVVHSQPAGSGETALRYLSRYVFKTATGDRRISQRSDGKLLWPYRDSTTGKWKQLVLEPFELIRRFLQHVLPRGYTRIRSYGWFHPAARKRLNRVRALLRQSPVLTQAEQETWVDPLQELAPPEPSVRNRPLCLRCKVEMVFKAIWQAGQTVPFYSQRAPPK